MINTIKKYCYVLFLTFFIFALTACLKPKDEKIEVVDFLDIYSINDFHGAVLDADGKGISRIGNYLIDKKEQNPNNTIILAAGDIFQGTGVSNLTYGGVVVEAMNYIGFDAMTIGNHEFDWGVEKLISFHDKSDNNVKADFPFLSANIYEKSTNKPVDWAEPYTIINRGDLKIGIIGTLGTYQINSITASLVEPYKFMEPVSIIKQITYDLRVNQDVDFVIVSSHDHEEFFNQGLIDLSGDYRVDAVINAHTHRTYAREDRRTDLAPLPIVQAGSSGSHIGHIRLNIDFENRTVTNVSARTIAVKSSLGPNNPEIDKIIQRALDKVEPILNEEIGTAGKVIYKNDAITWGANTIKKYSNADFGVINSGAFRTGFPINPNQIIKVSDIYQMMPFDNIIKTSKLNKYQILEALNGSDLVFSSNYNFNELEDDKIYTVATVDYVFDKQYYPFISGQDITYVGDLFRDYLIRSIKETKDNNQKWYAE